MTGHSPHSAGFADVAAGALFAAFGAAALHFGSGLKSGSAANMGPGYLPRLIAWGLVGFGIAIALNGLRRGGWRMVDLPMRPTICISLAVVAFALAIEPLGLVVTSVLTVVLAATGQRGMPWRQVPVIALGLAAFCALLFGLALGLPMPIWPR